MARSNPPRTPSSTAFAPTSSSKYAASVEDERPDGFASLLLDLVARLQPDGPLEEFCVETVATCMWRLRRVVGEENNLIDEIHADLENDRDEQELYRAPDSPELPPLVYPFLPKPEALLPLIRYESHLNRQRHAALRELNDLQVVRLSGARRNAWPPAPSPPPPQPSPAVSPVPSLGHASPAPTFSAQPAAFPSNQMPNEANRGASSPLAPADPPSAPSAAPATDPSAPPTPVPNEANRGPSSPLAPTDPPSAPSAAPATATRGGRVPSPSADREV